MNQIDPSGAPTVGQSRGLPLALSYSLALLIIIFGEPQAVPAGPPLSQDDASVARILLVDDSVSPSYHPDGASYFIEALDAGGFEYDIFVVVDFPVATVPSISVLCSYDVVIWTSGYHFNPFSGESARRVAHYLDGGGAMFVSSKGFANRNESDFMRDYFHIKFTYFSTFYLVDGEPNDPITSGMELFLESPASGDGREQACVVSPTDNYASPILRVNSLSEPNAVAVRVPSDGVSLPYRIVLTCFPFESLVDLDCAPDIRAEFIARTLNWLLDETTPSVKWTSPASGMNVLYPNSAISIELSDVGTGIDLESIELAVGGGMVAPELRTLQDCTSLLYVANETFRPGSLIQVQVSCQDRYRSPNQMEPYSYSFLVDQDAQLDTEAPYPLSFGPTGAVPVASEAFRVYAIIADDGTGVDRASLAITMDGQRMSASTERTDQGCVVFCAFPRDLGFQRDHEVVVTAQDLSFPPNQMGPLRFWFTLESDRYPPFVLRLSPPQGAVLDLDEFRQGRDKNRIQAWLRDFNGDVDLYSVRMTVNGRIATLSYHYIPNGLRVSYHLGQHDAGYNQDVFVELSASDTAFTPNQMEPIGWAFSFGDDRNPPTVQETIPSNGSSGVPRNTQIFFIVSEDVDPDSVNSDLITATMASVESGPTPINGQVSLDSDIPYVRFVPYQSLPSGATISVQMNASLLDRKGNWMAGPYEFQFTTSGDLDLEPPSSPTALGGAVGNGLIRITWRGSSGASFYRVYYDSDGCCEPYEGTDANEGASPIEVRAWGRSGDFFLSGLDNDKTYHVTVTAMDRCAGESDYSYDEFVASPERLPDAPHITEVQVGNGSVFLEWESSESISVRGYRVYYRMTHDSSRTSADEQDESWVDTGRSISCSLYGLTDEVVYEVWVVAYDDLGDEGFPSEIVAVTPSSDVDWLEFRLPGNHPPPRYLHKLVLDSNRKRIYLLGGISGIDDQMLSVLNLELFQWEMIPTTGPIPPPGECHAFYDADRDVVWMAAANAVVYRLDLSIYEWTAFEPVGDPPPTPDTEGATPVLPDTGILDTERNRLLFYGCYFSEGGSYRRILDFYSFDLETNEWATIEPPGEAPTESRWSALTYVPSLDRAFMFGGYGPKGMSSKLRMLDPETLMWFNLPSGAAAPKERDSHSLVFDYDFGRLLLFAGYSNGAMGILYEYDLLVNEWHDLSNAVTGIPPTDRFWSSALVVPRGTIDSSAYMLTYGGQQRYDWDALDDLHCLKLYAFLADTTPPARVDDLEVELSEDGTNALLSWTASGDDGSYGRAHGYDLRYSFESITTDDEFSAAAIVPTICLPSFPGTEESLPFELPEPGQPYYFALKAFDEAGNTSELSNCESTVSRTTPPAQHAVVSGPLEQSRHNWNVVIHTIDKSQALK